MSLYTNRNIASGYESVCRGEARIDFGDFPPQDIVATVIPGEKQDMVFTNLLRGLAWDAWKELVALLAEDGYQADDKRIAAILSYRTRKVDDVIIGAIKNNVLPAIRRLHKPGAKLGKNIIEELRQNRVVVIDTSLLPGEDSRVITGLLMRRIFHHNLRHFTEISGPTVRCLAVLEEAQTMLGDRRLDDRDVFVRWVKEGRKYGLGCILVTQQPGSISHQIISQGDNFFVLHLLNGGDLQILQQHNAYFTDEILSFIRSEPIPGNCYFWSAPNQPFVLPARVFDFESVCNAPNVSVHEEIPVKLQGKIVSQDKSAIVESVLKSNRNVWIYPVGAVSGKAQTGLLAFSADYLKAQVSNALGSKETGLEIEKFMKQRDGWLGYAALEGVTRQVWVIKDSNLKLAPNKKLQPASVDVNDSL